MHLCVPPSCDRSVEGEGLGCEYVRSCAISATLTTQAGNLCPSMRFLGDPCGARKGVSQSVGKYGLAESDYPPEGGVYGNEADVYDQDWERVFWGGNYEEMVRDKKKSVLFSLLVFPFG